MSGTTSRPIVSVSNHELYNKWAQCYDTDGNVLQAIDDQEIPALLTQFFELIVSGVAGTNAKCKITELGSGTGRNTAKLLQPPYVHRIGEIHGLDFSEEMLRIAKERCCCREEGSGSSIVSRTADMTETEMKMETWPSPVFHTFDAIRDAAPPATATGADGVLSTLVLEHVPLATFFGAVRKLFQGGSESRPGYLLLTNMHAEMGAVGQAGFIDAQTGQKLRGVSYAYTVLEMLDEAARQGFAVIGKVKERAIEIVDLPAVGERGRKWVGCKVWFGCILRYDGRGGSGPGES